MKVRLDRLKKKITNLWRKILCRKLDSASYDDICRKPLPENFLRGFNTKDCFTKEQNVAIGAFQFGNHTEDRNDNFHEASVNWEDDDNSVITLLALKKEGSDEPMFNYGYARLSLNLVKVTLKSLIEKNYLTFERKPLPNNPYHGNILIPGDISRPEKTMIQNNLAAIANNDTCKMNM